jgi:hypothetical protein
MNCLSLGDNLTFIHELLFGIGTGFAYLLTFRELHYYLFNYRVRDINPDQLGLVML